MSEWWQCLFWKMLGRWIEVAYNVWAHVHGFGYLSSKFPTLDNTPLSKAVMPPVLNFGFSWILFILWLDSASLLTWLVSGSQQLLDCRFGRVKLILTVSYFINNLSWSSYLIVYCCWPWTISGKSGPPPKPVPICIDFQFKVVDYNLVHSADSTCVRPSSAWWQAVYEHLVLYYLLTVVCSRLWLPGHCSFWPGVILPWRLGCFSFWL